MQQVQQWLASTGGAQHCIRTGYLLLVTQLQRHGISSGGAEGPGQGLQWQLHVSNCLHCPHCTRAALVDDRLGTSFSRYLIRAGAELLLVLIDHLVSPRQLHAAWVVVTGGLTTPPRGAAVESRDPSN